MDRFQKTIDILDRLIGFPTVSSDSNMACIDWISNYLRNLGADVKISSAVAGKANIFATLGPQVDGGIILSGHTDVVPVAGQNWSSDPFQMRVDGDRYYGRGACDMKGFIAACLAMAPVFAAQNLKRPVHFAFTYDEEVGCLGARVLINELIASGLKPSICIVGEPTSMRIIEGHKGMCEYTTEFHGVEGHSSQPDLGVNALEYATRFIAKLMEVRAKLPDLAPDGCRFDPPYSTSSICACHSGVAHNVIPNHASVEWEMRVVQKSDRIYLRGEMARFVDEVLRPEMREKSAKADIVETVCTETEGLEPDPNSEAIALVKELTGGNSTDVVAFGTEAGLFANAEISSVLCGPGSIEQAHKPDEFVSAEQLQLCLDMLTRLGGRLI
ncbi:acetylornithine deacetylase [Amylibacter marinus]|uniref:Acetylornithine deacetylase n=1 Tax=Amylibacter marinus TaxID=1475483 RepID=A0ABQ5VTE7_9RHOB|nr:acetylornithine deacetylase [Amylibacter marinus]GLQ34703.1 acetylornithine deacetylase [Amylibacter marinus]